MISPDLLVKTFGRHPIESREVDVEIAPVLLIFPAVLAILLLDFLAIIISGQGAPGVRRRQAALPSASGP